MARVLSNACLRMGEMPLLQISALGTPPGKPEHRGDAGCTRDVTTRFPLPPWRRNCPKNEHLSDDWPHF